jgi:hypothetical protein
MYFSERSQHKLESKLFHTVANCITDIEMVISASTSCRSNIYIPCSFLRKKKSLQRIYDKFEVILTAHRRYYVEIKCQLDATDVFIADLISCSTCFGAPLCPSSGAREYYTVGCRLWSLVLGFQVVGMLQPANRTHNPQLHTIPTT